MPGMSWMQKAEKRVDGVRQKRAPERPLGCSTEEGLERDGWVAGTARVAVWMETSKGSGNTDGQVP